MSYITNSSATQNEVLEGGRLITILNGNLVINNCQFYNNFIYYDTEGIFGVGANLTIIGCNFQQNQYAQYYTRLANPYLGDVNGDWVSLGTNSTMWIYNSTFNKGRGVYGGCINIQGTSQSMIFNTTFISCSALLGGGIYAVNFDSLVV